MLTTNTQDVPVTRASWKHVFLWLKSSGSIQDLEALLVERTPPPPSAKKRLGSLAGKLFRVKGLGLRVLRLDSLADKSSYLLSRFC